MSGSGFRGRGFGSRGIRPRGPLGVRGGPRFPRPPFNRPPFPRHGSENWHEPPAQPFFAPWQYNGRGHFPKFPVRPPFRHDVPFHHTRGRGSSVHGMPPRMRMPGVPALYRPELQSENEVNASPSHNEQHESSANLPQISPAPLLGSEEERQQKITEAADKLKQKLSSIKNQEVENFWEDDADLIPSTSFKEAQNKEIAELHPQDFSLTSHDLKDIGRVDLHRTPMQDDSVVVLDEICNRNFIEISVLDEEIKSSEGESECNVPNNEVEEEVDNVQENPIDTDIKSVPTIDSTVVQSRENTTLQTHQDHQLNFAEEIPHHNPSVSFNCRPEFHRGNVNTPPRFISRQMGPRFRMPYPQEMSPMGPGKPVPLRPMHPNSRPPNQLDVPRVMFDPHTPPPAVFNRLPPPSNFHSMDKNLNIDTLPQMQADPMYSGVHFGRRGPPSHLSSPSNIQCNSSNEERMNFPGFDPRKPPPSVITQEEVLQPPPVFDPRLSFQERQRLIPTVASAQLHPPLSMQVPSSTIPPPPPLSGPPPPPAPPGSLLEMVPMTDFDLMPNYSMTNKFDIGQSHFPQLPQQEALEPEQNYIDIEGELFMEPPPEPPILSDYCSPPLPETLPPVDAPLPPADAPLPPMDVPSPPVDAPLPPSDAPLPPANNLLPSTEVPLSQTEVPLPISEPPSALLSKKQGSTILCATEASKQQESPRVSKEAIPTSTSPPKTDMDKLKQKRFRMKKSKRENSATCSAPTVSMSPNDKVHTVQNQDNSKQYQNTIQEEVPLSEEQSRPKVVFNLNSKIKKISKQEEWQQQADTSTAKHRKLKAQIVALESPTNALRVKSYSQIRKMPSPKSSKSLISSRKRSEGRGRVSESSWKSTVIERFLKMSKNEIRNILNNSGLRKFDIAMKQLVKERRSSLSWEMRNTENEKIKSYDREQFICQLNEMLDPSATIDITNLPTEFIRHLGEVLQLHSLPQDQSDSIRNTEVEVTPVHTKSKSEPAESTYHKRHGKAISRSLIREENDISMNANEVHQDTSINNVQINVEKSKETRDSALNMDLDDIFLAGIAKAKHSTKSATPEKVVTEFDIFFGPSGDGASQTPMVIEPVPETEKFQEEMTFVESRIDKCERWHRKARDDPDMFRNLTKEEWEAKYGKSNNDDEISKAPSRFDSNESSSNKEDIGIDSIKSVSIKNVIDRNPRVGHSTTLPVNKYGLNIAKSSSLRQEYQSNKGRTSDSNSTAVAEVIESISPIEMSGTTWRERSSETCQTIGKSVRETKSGEDSNERRSTSETRRDKLFTEIGSNRKDREGMSSSRKSRRRERKRKTRKEKERRRRKRRVAPHESSSSYSESESDSMTLFTELEIKKEIIVKDEPGLQKVQSSIEKTISRPEPTECNNQSAQQELTTDKTLLANKTIVTNQEPVTNKELITSQELSTTQECTSNKDTSLQTRKQSKPTILEMSKVPNKILMEILEKESAGLKTINGGNNANSQALDTTATTEPWESKSKTSHSVKLDVQKEKHAASTSRSVKDKVLDKSKQEKNDISSVTVLTKDIINIPQKSDKRSKDIVPKDAENVRSSSIDELSVKKSGGEAADKVDRGNGTVRSKSNEERPSMKFQNIKSEGRKEMKLIEEKVKKRSSSLLRDKKSGATKHSKMLTTELKSSKVKIQKEKASSGTADSSEHKKQMIQVQIPTEDNPDLKDPRLSKLEERVQQSPNKSAKDCHGNIFSEKSSVDSTTEEQAKRQTQHSQSTLTSHGNINKTLRDIERNVRTPLTVEACTVDFNAKAAENTSPEVTSPRSLDSPFRGFSEESQLPSEQLARSTLLRSQAEFLNSATVSDESIREETYKNSALYIKTTSPNEDSSLQNQETTSTEVLPEKSEEPQSKDVTNLLVISASGDISDIQKDESIEVQVSSDSLNEKAKSDKLIIDEETHVQGMCIDTGTRVDENIEQDKVYENIIDTVKSVEKLQDVNTLMEEHLEKETSKIVEKLEPVKIFDPIITLEQEGIKGLEVAEVGKVEQSSAVRKLLEPAERSKVEKVTVVAKKYELVKIDTTVKPIVVTKGQEVEKSAVAENLQVSRIHELEKATEPLKVLDVMKSSSMVKSHEKVNSNEAMKIHEVVKLSVAKKTQERHKPHEMVKTCGKEKLRVAEKTQEITKTHGSKRLEAVPISEAVKSSLVRKTRDRCKVREIAKIDEVKESTAVEKTQEFAKLHDMKKGLEVVKPSAARKRHDVTKSPEVVKSSVELKGHNLVETPGVEKKSEVIESFITLKQHDIEKSSGVEDLTEVRKSPVILKRHEVVNSPDVQQISEVQRAHEVIKPPVALKRHDFLKSHEVVKSCEVEEMTEIVKASGLLKRYDPEKIPEIVQPSVLLRRLDVNSPMTKNMQEEVKPFVTVKSHEVVDSPIVEKVQEVVKPPTTLKTHEEVKSPAAEKAEEVIKQSTSVKRHKGVKSPIVEKRQEVVTRSTTLKRHEEVKSPAIEKEQEVVKPSTTLKRHKEVKSPVAEKTQEVIKPSITLKRHKAVKSPVVEKEQELVQPSATSKRHEEIKSPVVEKIQEVIKPSTTLKRHEVVTSPIAEKEQELVKPSTISKRHEEVKSPAVEKIQEIIKPSTTLKRHKVVKSPVVEKGQEAVTPSTTLKRHEVVKSSMTEKEQELLKPSTTSKRHEEVKSPVVEKIQEIIKPSTTLKRHKVIKSSVVEKGQEAVTPSTTLKRHEVVKSPITEKEQELVQPSTASKRHEEVKSPVVKKIQEIIKPSTTLKRHKVVKSPIVEKGQEAVTPSTTLKRHEVVKSPIAEEEQELIQLSTISKRHEQVKLPVVGNTEEVINPSTTLEKHEVVNLPVVEKTQEVVKTSEAFESYESPEMEKISGVIKIQQQVKTDEITKTSEVIKIQQQVQTDEITKTQEVRELCVEHIKAHEVSKLHEPSASTSKSINKEVTESQAEIDITKSRDQLNHHHEKSQETSPETGVSHPNVTKVDSSESSKCEEKITKRRRVSRWQDNNDIPKAIEPIQSVEKPKIRPRARKESKKHDNDSLHKIRSKQKFKDKKSKAPTTLDKILSRENAMTKESVMSRMIEIDLEIHKLMTEKMTLYQQLNSESSLQDDNQSNTKDNHESRNKKRKEVSAEKLIPPRLSSHNKLFLEKGHPPSHQSTHGARNKAILFDNSQADYENSRKDTLVHVFDNSYEKHQRQTSTSISEAKEGRSVDHVNIEIDKSSFSPENKGKKRLRLDKPDIENTHNKGITSSKESLNALKNYKKIISRPEKKTNNDIATVREVNVESKFSTSPKYPKDNDDSTNVEENVLEGQHATRITEDRLQLPVGVDEESKSSENVSKRSDSKTMERLSIYSDDSTRESSLTLESNEAKKCTTGLALLEETFKREMAISRKLKAAARKHKKEEIETLLKNVNSLTVDEEEIPLNVLFEMKQKQKQHLLEEMGVKSKLEKFPEKSEENSATIWKHAMAVINAVAENRTENVTVDTHELEVPNLGQLVELSTERTLLEVETTVKSSDTDKIDNTGTLETMTLISKNIPEPPVSIEIMSPISKAVELYTLNGSRHENLVHTENTPASTENTEKDLISKDSKKEKSDIQSDTLSKNEVKELSAKVTINDTTDSVKNDHDQIIGNENKRLTGGEDERNTHEIGKTTEAEKEDEDPSVVLNKNSADNIECPGTSMDSEDNSINENLTNNLDNAVINAETENEATNSSTILNVQKDKAIVSPEKESATEMKKVDPVKSKEDLNTSLELESLKEIHEAVKETMDDLVNSVTESSFAEAISRGNEDYSQKKEEGRPVKSKEINFQIEEFNRSGSNDFLGFPVSSQTSVVPTEKAVQPSTSTSEEIETTVLKRGRGRPKKRLSTNSSLSGTMSPVPSTSTIPEKRPKNVQSHGKRKSIVLEPRAARKTRKTRSSRSSVELPGVAKEVDPLETSVDAELLSSKGIFVEESKKRKYISQLQLKNCKVRLIDCESTYLRPDCDPSLLHQYGISRINAYGRTISIQCEPSLKIEDNKRSASVTSVQEVITPGYDIVHVESDKEKDSSSFCSWDQNIQEIPESIDVSQDSISQEEITRSRKNYNYKTIENCEDTNENEHVYLSHLDPTVLRQDKVSSPQPVIDINEDESAANTSSQSDIEILEATKESRSLNQVEDTEGEKLLTKVVLEEEKLPRTEYTVHKGPVLDIKVYGDSFMAASEDGTIYRYSQVSNGILNIYRGHKSAVTCLCIPKINFSGISRQWLFSGSLDGTLRCYEIDSGQQVRESVDVGSPIQCMDHAWGVIFLGTKSGHVSRFHIKSGVMKGDNIQFSEVSVLALKATSEGPRRVLIVASRNQPITIRDAQNGLFLRTVSGHKNHTVYSLMMDHHMVYCGTSGTLIPVFDFITAEQVTQYNAGVGIVCMRLYKKLLFAGCYDGNIYVFNTKDRKLVCSIPGPGNMLLSMEVVDNKIIAGSKDRGLHIWLMPKAVRALINNKSRNARMKEI